MTKKLVMTIFCLAGYGAGCGQGAYAAQLGPYVGGTYGVVESQAEFQSFDNFTVNQLYPFIQFTPIAHAASLDAEDQGYTGLVGYRVTAHLAIEGMFTDLGEVTYRASGEGTFNDGPQLTTDTEITGEASGIGLYALGIIPFGYRWEVYARGGVQFTSTGAEGRLTDGTNSAILDFGRKSTTDYVAGVGIAMSIFEIYGARLEYARVFEAADGSVSEGDIDLLSLGIIVAF